MVALDARSADCRAQLANWLGAGCTAVLLGSSGAGKSTLINSLLVRDEQRTSAVRRGDGRGRHTTTARSLHRIDGAACIVDTPGLRTLRLDLDEAAVAVSFADIAALSPQCRFRNCRHAHEPGCAVRDQVPPDRLRGFLKLQREARARCPQRVGAPAAHRAVEAAQPSATSACRSEMGLTSLGQPWPGRLLAQSGEDRSSSTRPGPAQRALRRYNATTDMHKTVCSRSSPLHRMRTAHRRARFEIPCLMFLECLCPKLRGRSFGAFEIVHPT